MWAISHVRFIIFALPKEDLPLKVERITDADITTKLMNERMGDNRVFKIWSNIYKLFPHTKIFRLKIRLAAFFE